MRSPAKLRPVQVGNYVVIKGVRSVVILCVHRLRGLRGPPEIGSTHTHTQFITPGGLNPKGQLCTSTSTILKMDPGLPKPIRPPFPAYVLPSSVLLSADPRGLVIT